MTLDEFQQSATAAEPPAGLSGPLKGLWHEAKGDWHRAHQCLQGDPTADASWVHAYLHRKEGDPPHADKWYSAAGRKRPAVSFEQEWRDIASELLAGKG